MSVTETLVPEPTIASEEPPARRWLDPVLAVALFVATIATRLPNLGKPRAFIFDEIYYSPDAASIVRNGVEQGGVVHPPGGKWLIALGIRVFGFTPFGWRISAVVAGALIVVLTYVIARQLVDGYWLPVLAGAAVALDGVAFTTSRVGMLDVFLALFSTAAIAWTVIALRHGGNRRVVRWCTWGAAVSLGLGLTVKWSEAYLLLAVVLAFVWPFAFGPRRRHQGRRVLGTIAILTLVPAGVYLLSYVPWIVHADKTYMHIVDCRDDKDCSLSLANRVRQFVEDQKRVWDFQTTTLQNTNSNAAPAWEWWNQQHPTTMYRQTCLDAYQHAPDDLADQACSGAKQGQLVEIVTVANPVLWFTALVAFFVVAWKAIRRRDLALLFLLMAGIYQWVFWAVSDRYSYSFYISPLIPVFALWVAVALSGRILRWLAPAFAVLLLAGFAFYYPIWAGRPLTPDQVNAREYWKAW